MIYKYDLFSSRFFLFEHLFDCDKIDTMVDLVKNNLPDEAKKGEYFNGPTYNTNYHSRYSFETVDLTEPIILLNENLKNERCFVELREPPWYAEYGPTDCHDPHLHCNLQYNINPEGDPKKWNFSLIISLSDIGSTTFFNANYAGLSNSTKSFDSKRGMALLFPSNILHWALPHRVEGQTRRIISANLLLQYEEEWLCL
tara:strand:+ start:85 stop:681 length:597 start_codon:yes stop_codon:yes gene_type:complete